MFCDEWNTAGALTPAVEKNGKPCIGIRPASRSSTIKASHGIFQGRSGSPHGCGTASKERRKTKDHE